MVKKKERDVWQELKQHLMEQISNAATQSQDFNLRSLKSSEDAVTPASTYFAFASMTHRQFFDLFILLDNAYDYLLELEKKIELKSAQLQRIMLEMAEHSNINVKYLQTELVDVKDQMQNPMLARIDQFLMEYKKADEKRKKDTETKRKELGDQYVE